MSRSIIILFVFISSFSFGQEERELMYRIHDAKSSDLCGYVNQNGDTIVPVECLACFSDSLNYAIIIKYDDHAPGFSAIGSQGNEIFRVFAYDNGPDYIEDGTMRIIENGKIGYASETGEIIIEPQYEAAWPFENGRAQVSIHATKEQDGEHWFWIDTDYFFIDKNGNRIEE